ncbi:glycosyltransferase family 2 protein [Roseibium algae]|uniref:Glycosyltransferase family 2 protein n=1 Tax=Roseibium algae TaxID=3123038 RepID=A0ABU8TI26_9HYPH
MQEQYSGELEILRLRGIADGILQTASREAEKLGISPAEYLVSQSIVSEAAVYSALAEHCRVPFVPEMGFRPQSVNGIPLGFGSLDNGPLLIGMSPTSPQYIIAPEFDQFEQVTAHLHNSPELTDQVRISTPNAIRYASTVLNAPSGDLESRFPEFSAKARFSKTQLGTLVGVAAAFLVGFLVPKDFLFYSLSSLFSLACALAGIARWTSAKSTERDQMDLILPVAFQAPEIRWPTYTVLVPLYREAASVSDLVQGLRQIDYPTDKLDIKFLLECDDLETRKAFRGNLDDHMEVVIVPEGFPRTKPRALAYGLENAAGEFITVYDAEDRPQPDQLKKAALFFTLGPENLACLQARLAIDNADESFFTRQYALEYACLFDQVLPWFYQQEWPFPLGGTSNHFRRAVLDSIGGWDKYNVTEDADLGIRLARFGYLCGVFPSTTYEEAPISFKAWLHQRSRWYKGWLQTLCVHLREPARTLREVGATRFAVLTAMIGGSFVMMASHPFIVLAFLGYISGLLAFPNSDNFARDIFLALCLCGAVLGYVGAAMAMIRAGRRRNYRPNIADLILLPAYWLCGSVAFYRSVWEFFMQPYVWNKTEHGVSQGRRDDAT